MRQMSSRMVLLIAVVIGALLGVATYAFGDHFTADAATKTSVVSEDDYSVQASRLLGEWRQSRNDIPNTYMNATISEDEIKIVLRLDSGEEGDADAAGTYWAGSFDTSKNSDHFEVTSMADKDALSYSVLGSQDRTKTFFYNNGILSFNFSIMGQNTTVQLERY